MLLKAAFLACSLGLLNARTPATHKITIDDPKLGSIERQYKILTPHADNKHTPYGLLFVFHGWTEGCEAASSYNPSYNDYVDEYNYIVVYPCGLSDFRQGHGWDSWNVGYEEEYVTCTKQAQSYCYDSCAQLGECTDCSWTTCYDDIHFTKQLMHHIRQQYTIDESHVGIIGFSNGGMFTFYLAGHVQATHFIPVYGNPPATHVPTPSGSVQHIMAHHGREDTTVPLNGGESDDHFIYMGQTEVLTSWGVATGCISENDLVPLTPISTPFDGGNRHQECFQYLTCQNTVIMACNYDGGHGASPHNYIEHHLWFIYDYANTNLQYMKMQ